MPEDTVADPFGLEVVMLGSVEAPSGSVRVFGVSGFGLTVTEFDGTRGPNSPDLELLVANEYDNLVICPTILVVTWHCSSGPWARNGDAQTAHTRNSNGLIFDYRGGRRHEKLRKSLPNEKPSAILYAVLWWLVVICVCCSGTASGK